MSKISTGRTFIQSLPLSLLELCRLTFRSVSSPENGKSITVKLPAPSNELVEMLRTEIELGEKSLNRWRAAYHNKTNWSLADSDDIIESTLGKICPTPATASSSLQRHDLDKQFVRDAVMLGNCVLSPFITLNPLNASTDSPVIDGTSTFIANKNIPAGVFLMSIPTEEAVVADESEEGAAALEYHNRQLESSASAMNNACGLTLNDLKDGNTFFLPVESLAMYLAIGLHPENVNHGTAQGGPTDDRTSSEDKESSFFEKYCQYLAGTVAPPKNLAFMKSEDFLFGSKTGGNEEGVSSSLSPTSTAHALWKHFHEYRKGQPLNRVSMRRLLQDDNTTNRSREHVEVADVEGNPVDYLSQIHPPLSDDALQEYKWIVSVVLSRRLGPNLMVPLLDKLNHCVPAIGVPQRHSTEDANKKLSKTQNTPNCYYTMATEQSMCGLDIFDNLLAGVSVDRLFVPHIHLFSLKPIRKDEALTLSYSDINPNATATLTHGEHKEEERQLLNTGSTSASATPHRGNDDNGALMWKALWGFVPNDVPAISEPDLMAMASIISERRLLQRKILFPSESHHSNSSQ